MMLIASACVERMLGRVFTWCLQTATTMEQPCQALSEVSAMPVAAAAVGGECKKTLKSGNLASRVKTGKQCSGSICLKRDGAKVSSTEVNKEVLLRKRA